MGVHLMKTEDALVGEVAEANVTTVPVLQKQVIKMFSGIKIIFVQSYLAILHPLTGYFLISTFIPEANEVFTYFTSITFCISPVSY